MFNGIKIYTSNNRDVDISKYVDIFLDSESR